MTEPTYLSGTDRPRDDVPRRVAALVPWVSESLAELALADRLLAVTDDALTPEGAFAGAERVGPSADPDMRRLLELEPDLVLVGPNQMAAFAAAQAAGIPVWLADPRTVRESFNLLWDWMNAFEGPQMVARVRAMEWMCDWLERLIETRPAPARVLALLSPDPLVAVAGGSYAHDLLRVCGGDALFGDDPAETVLLHPRDVADLQPDVLLLATGGTAGFSEADVAAYRATATPAAQTGRVFLTDRRLLTWPGTQVARAFDVLPALLELAR